MKNIVKVLTLLALVMSSMFVSAQFDAGAYRCFQLKETGGYNAITCKISKMQDGRMMVKDAQRNKPISGRCRVVLASNKYVNCMLKAGYVDGEVSEYLNKALFIKSTYSAGVLNGPYVKNLSQGKARIESNYRQGQLVTYTQYYPSGKVNKSSKYVDGKLDGLDAQYDEKGNVIAQGEWIVGVKNGKFIERKDGAVITSNFAKGIPVGDYLSTYPSGRVKERGAYDNNGKKTGKWETFGEDGKIRTSDSYIAGKFDGEVLQYGEKGKLVRESNFIDGRLCGKVIEYNSITGKKMIETSYIDNHKNGVSRQYYDNGKVSIERFWNNDVVLQEKAYKMTGIPTYTKKLSDAGSLSVVERYGANGEINYTNNAFVGSKQLDLIVVEPEESVVSDILDNMDQDAKAKNVKIKEPKEKKEKAKREKEEVAPESTTDKDSKDKDVIKDLSEDEFFTPISQGTESVEQPKAAKEKKYKAPKEEKAPKAVKVKEPKVKKDKKTENVDTSDAIEDTGGM